MSLVTYRREGGGHPLLDEELTVEADGAFQMVRRVSVDRVGKFVGELDPEQRQQLSDALEALDELPAMAPGLPPVVMEEIDWAGGSASFPLEHELPSPWQAARDVLQGLVEDLKRFPSSALELRLDASGSAATLTVLGYGPVAADLSGAAFAIVLFGPDFEHLGSASVPLGADIDAGPLPAGWRLDIPLLHGLDFDPARTLQVTLEFSLDKHEAQLVSMAGKPWF
jgi:hypothetical protein